MILFFIFISKKFHCLSSSKRHQNLHTREHYIQHRTIRLENHTAKIQHRYPYCNFSQFFLKIFCRFKKNALTLHSQMRNNSYGRLAQLVQSICLTSRGSAVRIRQRPPKNRLKFDFSRFCFFHPHSTKSQNTEGSRNKQKVFGLAHQINKFTIHPTIQTNKSISRDHLACYAARPFPQCFIAKIITFFSKPNK